MKTPSKTSWQLGPNIGQTSLGPHESGVVQSYREFPNPLLNVQFNGFDTCMV